MKIRTQLILAFLLLSVVPLSGIVLYSYYSSQKAVRAAIQAEAERMARELDGRVTQVRDEVTERVATLGRDVDLSTMIAEGASGQIDDPVAGRIASAMAPVAPFVEALEYVPSVVEAFEDPASMAELGALGALGSLESFGRWGGESPAPTPDVPGGSAQPAPVAPPAPPVPQVAGVEGGRAVPPTPPVPVVVIDVEQILADVTAQLQRSGMPMSPEREAELREQLQQAEQVQRRIVIDQTAADLQRQQTALNEARLERERARHERLVERAREQAERIRERETSRTASPVGSAAPASPPQDPGRSAVRVMTHPRTAPRETSILFGKELRVPVTRDGEVIGQLEARMRPDLLIRSILALSDSEAGEIAFAIDREGSIHARNEPERETVQKVVVDAGEGRLSGRRIRGNWIVATSVDEESGLTVGILRPTREPLEQVRKAAARNFAYGLGLIGIALIGIIPLANHMTRDVELVTEGAERIAQGDLETEVPVRSANEFGTLAVAFNRMARDLREHQARLLEEQQRRKEQEIQQRLLAADFARKSGELEEARRFQLSLLPKQLPSLPGLEIAVHMRTATEVGGDYYDFHVDRESGELTIALGDATGHGVRAGTMVTIVKSLFSTYGAGKRPSEFLEDAGANIRGMELGRMAMAFLLARIAGRRLTISSAAMPPALLFRSRTRRVEELAVAGMPLGTFGGRFEDLEVELESGDTLLLLSDGFPELLDARGEPLGYPAVENAFGMVASLPPDEIIAALSAAADRRTGGQPPNDDITFVVVRVG